MNAAADTRRNRDEKGIKISDGQIKALETSQLHRHEFHGDWNYTLDPTTRPNTPT